MENKNFSLINNILYSLVAVGYFIILFFPKGSLFGYSGITGAIFLIYMLEFIKIVSGERSNSDSIFQFISKVSYKSWPLLMLLTILGWVVYLNVRYNDNIKAGNTTTEYQNFSNINLFLLAIQFYLLNRYLNPKTSLNVNLENPKSNTGKILNLFLVNAPLLILLIGLIQLITVGIMDINLSDFTTDG